MSCNLFDKLTINNNNVIKGKKERKKERKRQYYQQKRGAVILIKFQNKPETNRIVKSIY